MPQTPRPRHAWKERFRHFAHWVAEACGSSEAFFIAVVVILVWLATGPFFHYSDTWQLIINTGTTIVTFLMVFLIQNAQNRDSRAIHLKLDELIRGVKGARTHLVGLEQLSDDERTDLQDEFRALHERLDKKKGQPGTAFAAQAEQEAAAERERRKTRRAAAKAAKTPADP